RDGPQGKFVYVAGKDKDGKDVAMPKPVALGDWVAGDGTNLWLVESGLAAGDRVLVDGIAKLMPGGQIKLAATVPAPAAGAITNAPSGAEPPAKEPVSKGAAPPAPPADAAKKESEDNHSCSRASSS